MPSTTKRLDYATPPLQELRTGLTNTLWLAIATAVTLVIVISLSQAFAVDVVLGITLDGLVALAWCAAAIGLSPSPLGGEGWGEGEPTSEQARRVNAMTLLRWITSIALGLGVMGLLFLLLGLSGVLNRTTVLAIVVVGLALFAYRARSHAAGVKAWTAQRGWGGAALLVFAVPLGIALICVSIAPGFLWKPLDPHPYDVMSYHLQVPREWFDAGQIIPLKHNAFSFFPMAMEVHYLATMHFWGGPWAGMYLCQMLTLLHGVLAIVAVIGVAEALGAPRRFAVMGGLLAATVPWTLMLSTVAYVESGVMLYTVLAFGWAAIALRSNRQSATDRDNASSSSPSGGGGVGTADAELSGSSGHNKQAPPPSLPRWGRDQKALLLAFACAGFACGFKYTSFAMIAAPLVVLWPIVAIVSKRITVARALRCWLVASVCLLLVVSPWLMRNVTWTGNPVFPLATSIFGKAHFTNEQVTRYERAHQPPPAEASVGQRIAKGFERTVTDQQFGYVLIPLTLLASLLIARRAEGVLLIALMLTVTFVWLLATHVMPRFITPMIPVMAVVCAVGMASLPRTATPAATLGVFIVAQCSIAFGFIYAKLDEPLQNARFGLFRLPDYMPLEAREVTDAKLRGKKIALVGDAQAFFMVVPSDRLKYSTVFDVRSDAHPDVAAAWLNARFRDLQATGHLVVVNFPEMLRLHDSYRIESPLPSYVDANRMRQDGSAGVNYLLPD